MIPGSPDRIVRARQLFDGHRLLRDVLVRLADDGSIAELRPGRPGDPDAVDGVVVPGLVNAHLHLELSHLALVPGGDSLVGWVARFIRARALSEADPKAAMTARAAELVENGVAAVSDIANTRDSAPILAAAGISGVVQWEQFGLNAAQQADLLANATAVDETFTGPRGSVTLRPSPHAPHTTSGAVIRASVGGDLPGRPPASIHLAEDHAEVELIERGSGPFAALFDRAGMDWRWWQAPGVSPAEYLDQLGVLGPRLLCVHGVRLSPHDRALLARRQAPLALCPRSNLHISGDLPDVEGLINAGVRLCIGTDSLASSPSLDVLAELPVLADAFDIEAERLLSMCTAGGADALGLRHLGTIEVGRAPGLLQLDADDLRDIVARGSAVQRRWLAPAGIA